jgi:type IV secretion system protein TrbC
MMMVANRISATRLALALQFVLARAAIAATSGPTMPWDTPLSTIRDSLSGTVAHILVTVAVITTGLVFAFSEAGTGARRLFGVAFGGAIALGALSVMTAIGFAGATF